MTAEGHTTSPQKPGRGLSATQMGYFGILGEIIAILVVAFVGMRFLIADARPDVVAWVSFGVGVILLADMVRRILRARRRNAAE